MVPYRCIFSALLLVGALHLHSTAEISTGNGSCFYQGCKQVSGAVSFSKLGLFSAVDIGILDLVSIGGVTGYNRYDELTGWQYRRFPVLGRVALHPLNFSFLADLLLIRDRIDLYGGIAAGFIYIHSSWNGIRDQQIGTPDESGVSIGPYLGLRLSLTDRWQVFVENCGDASAFALGVGMRF